MASPLNVPITPPRVAFIDPRTGNVAREWYMFFLSLFTLTGGSSVSLDDVQKGPPSPSIDELAVLIERASENLTSPSAGLTEQLAELTKQVSALQMAPQFDGAMFFGAIAALNVAPVTKTADFTVSNGEKWIINNKSGSSCVVTLPTASSGRELHFLNYQKQTLVSASSNVVPLAGGSAGTAILEAVAGANTTLVSDGTNWVMTQYDSNNALQLE